MRPARLVTCAAVLAAAVPFAAASAAGRVCRLVVDPTGDQDNTNIWSTEKPSSDLDVVSGDIATNDRAIRAVIRVATLSPVGPTDVLDGHGYGAQFTANGVRYEMRMTHGPDGYSGTIGTDHNRLGQASVEIDYDAREVRITAQASRVNVKKGVTLSDLLFVGAEHKGPGSDPADGMVWNGSSAWVDQARGKKPYVAGTPSCVRVPD